MIWYDIKKTTYPPEDTWFLVRNSAGFFAAVNQITEHTGTDEFSDTDEFRGWTVTPEREKLLIGDITHWAVIEPPVEEKT